MAEAALRLYMLDTNAASAAFSATTSRFRARLAAVPITSLCISSITRAELRFGIALVANRGRLHEALQAFLARVDTLPWNADVADRYGDLRAKLQRRGKPLGNLDTLIAAHALTVGAILVTNDRVFRQVPDLIVENWLT